MSPLSRRVGAWSLTTLWALSIYLVIPFARAIQGWVYEHLGRGWFLRVVFAFLAAGLVAVFLHFRRRSTPRPAQLLWVALVALAYGTGAWLLRASPEEAMHFVQYGVLSLLLFRSLRLSRDDAGLPVLAFVIGSFLGTLDETVQWVTPRRFFDFRDIFINVLAVGLMQVALWSLRGPVPPAAAPTRRLAVRWAFAWALLLTFLLSATPARLARFWAWSGLPAVDEALIEYGQLHRLPGGIAFRSRLDAEGLLREDRRIAQDADALEALRAGDRGYEDFLRAHPSWRDPFLHELRVHLFRRDRYWKEARTHRDDPERHAQLITISFREQEILEAHFAQTLRAADLDWPADLRERARQGVRPGPYASPVSRHLVTWPGWLPPLLPWVFFLACLPLFRGRQLG